MLDSSKKSQIIKYLLSPAFVIAIISAIAYLCAYLQEMGFCNYYGIPTDFIVIGWTRFLPLTAYVVAGALYGITISAIALDINLTIRRAQWLRDSKHAHAIEIVILIITVATIATMFWLESISAYILLAGMIVGIIYIPIFYHRNISLNTQINELINKASALKETLSRLERRLGEYSVKEGKECTIPEELKNEVLGTEKQWQDIQILAERMSGEIKISKDLDGFFKKVKVDPLLIIKYGKILCVGVVCIFILGFAAMYYITGLKVSENQKNYFVVSSNPQLVVLRTYGDNLICAPWFTETVNGSNQSYVIKEYHIVKLSDAILVPKEIGPLKVISKEQITNSSSNIP